MSKTVSNIVRSPVEMRGETDICWGDMSVYSLYTVLASPLQCHAIQFYSSEYHSSPLLNNAATHSNMTGKMSRKARQSRFCHELVVGLSGHGRMKSGWVVLRSRLNLEHKPIQLPSALTSWHRYFRIHEDNVYPQVLKVTIRLTLCIVQMEG